MIVGIGVDVVDVQRFAATLARTPRLLPRLFAPAERVLKPRSLAARYAAKEAFIKALGGSDGVHWTDIEVAAEPSGRPVFSLHGETAATVAARGITALHLSMSHDAGLATAYVIAEAGDMTAPPAVIPALQPAPPTDIDVAASRDDAPPPGDLVAPGEPAAAGEPEPAAAETGETAGFVPDTDAPAAHAPASVPDASPSGADASASGSDASTSAAGVGAQAAETAVPAPDSAREDTA